MVKWRLLSFLRLSTSNRSEAEIDEHPRNSNSNSKNRTNTNELEESIGLPKRFDEKQSSFGCVDELDDVKNNASCSNLEGLFAEDGTCRWPSAELCLLTCGQCPRVLAANKCTSLQGEMHERMVDEHIHWNEFFHNITSTEMQEKHQHLKGARILNMEDPWVAEFPYYLTETETDELIRIASVEGYRIEDEHPKHIRDVNVTNCDSIRCMRQPFVSELYRRASHLLGFHPNNFEAMEFIDYGPGQHYAWHADEYSWKDPSPDPASVTSGPRMLTMFHYLSDVEEGGETAFAGPDSTGKTKRLAVKPKRGKVILWANMKDNWRFNEPAAVHSAIPVRRGRKLAATLWIHASGFRVPELYAGLDCNPRYA